MRICHVIEAAGGGSGQVVLELARYGLAHGDDVTVIYAPERAEASWLAALNALPHLRLVPSTMQRKIGLRDVIDEWKLYRQLRTHGPFDIIHGHSSKAGALTRLVGPFVAGTVLYTPHGFYSMMPGIPAFYGLIERMLSWLGPAVISVSRGEWQHSEQLGIAATKRFLIPNGASPHFTVSREQARRTLAINDECVLFGFVGRMVLQKNPRRALKAFAQIATTHPRAHLIMIGDGPLRAYIESECRKLDLQERVTFVGACDARAIIPAFDALIGSSEFETLPISFLECLHAGVPILTTKVGGTDEAVIEGTTGFVARDFSDEALAEALQLFLNLSPQQRQAMARACQNHATSFRAETMGKKYRELYRRFCSA